MFKQNYIIYIIFIFIFIFLIYKNKTNNTLENFIDTCQYRLQSFNNMFVLLDKTNNIIKRFASKEQYLNYVKYELKDTECIISDTSNEYTNEKFEIEEEIREQEKQKQIEKDRMEKEILDIYKKEREKEREIERERREKEKEIEKIIREKELLEFYKKENEKEREIERERREKEKEIEKIIREKELLDFYKKEKEKEIERERIREKELLDFYKNNSNNNNSNNNNNLIQEQQKNNNKNMKENKSYEIQMNLDNINKKHVRDSNKYAQCFKLHNECLNSNEPSKCNMEECLLKDDIIKENIKKQYESDMKKNIYSYRDNWTMPQAQPPICITESNKKCKVCPTFIDKSVNNLLQIKDVDDSMFENWKEGNKINTNFNIITSEWKQKNDIAEPQNYIPPKCPFDDCQPCDEILMNNSEHPSVIIGKNLLPKFKYEEY